MDIEIKVKAAERASIILIKSKSGSNDESQKVIIREVVSEANVISVQSSTKTRIRRKN